MRSTFVKTLIKLAETDERIFLITPDLGFSVLEEFAQCFPDRFLNVGIAEANAVGIAAGLAMSGKIVYVYSIIPFVTMRPFEQVRVDLAYMNNNVRLVGVGAGLTYGPAGATHHAIEDLSLMRSLPNMTVLSPCDPVEVEGLVNESREHQGPIYIRLARNGEPRISKPEANIAIGKVNPIAGHEEDELAILFTGNASDVALGVSNLLSDSEISSQLVSVHSLKPLDTDAMDVILRTKRYIFTLEEHSRIGGLGSAVAEVIAESEFNPVFKRFGLPDQYSHVVGDQKCIAGVLGFSAAEIADEIVELMK